MRNCKDCKHSYKTPEDALFCGETDVDFEIPWYLWYMPTSCPYYEESDVKLIY